MDNVRNNSPATKAIQQRMEEVRSDLDEDVQEIVEGVREIGQWRSYVRTYPWVCLGAAVAVGYWIVPRPRSLLGIQANSQALAELAKQNRLLATSHLPPKGNSRLRALVGNLVMRGVVSLVVQQADKLFATQSPSHNEPINHDESHS